MNTTTNKKTRIVVPTLLLIGACTLFSGSALAAYATTSQLTAETNARKAADNTEKNARIAADNGLKTQLTAEQTARQAADASLTTDLANEKNDREQSDIALGTAYKQDLQAAILQLEARISALSALIIPPPPANTVRPKQGLTLKLCPGNDTPQWETCPLAIGDTGPAGGVVFYLFDTTGKHGLEAAPADQVSAPWGCDGVSVPANGYGVDNTAAILAGCTENGIAARVAVAYSLNGYHDWYLPSKDELFELYKAKEAGFVGGFTTGNYWSSTEYAATAAYYMPFGPGWKSYPFSAINKWASERVRAIRSF